MKDKQMQIQIARLMDKVLARSISAPRVLSTCLILFLEQSRLAQLRITAPTCQLQRLLAIFES